MKKNTRKRIPVFIQKGGFKVRYGLEIGKKNYFFLLIFL